MKQRRFGSQADLRARRRVADAFARQARRLDALQPGIQPAVQKRTKEIRLGQAVAQVAAKHAEFAHALVVCYRSGLYSPMAAMTRTVLEDASLTTWAAIPDDTDKQRERLLRIAAAYYRTSEHKGTRLQPDIKRLIASVTGEAARKPPSFEDRLRQLDDHERSIEGGIPFWVSHTAGVEMSNTFVHSNLVGPMFTDDRTNELLGFQSLAVGHQYFCIGFVSIARLAGRSDVVEKINAGYERVAAIQSEQRSKLIK
jgi:hypothetical protein